MSDSETKDDFDFIKKVVNEELANNGMADLEWGPGAIIFSYRIPFPEGTSREVVEKVSNDIFHRLGLLPQDENMAIGDLGYYCQIESETPLGGSIRIYSAIFNDPIVATSAPEDMIRVFVLKNYRENMYETGDFNDMDEDELECMLSDIKGGKLNALTKDLRLAITAEEFDAIANGKQAELVFEVLGYYLKRVIGTSQITLTRGYGKPGYPPKHMKLIVREVKFRDDNGKECDPYNVPEDFWPVEIVVYLGNRINEHGERIDAIRDMAEKIAWEKQNNEPLPWEGRDDLIMSNEEYWRECDKALKGNKDFDIPDNVEEMSDEEFAEFNKRFASAYHGGTEKIFERRWLGCQKAMYEWEQGGCKGERPEDISMLMALP